MPKSLAVELAGDAILTNSGAPGGVETDMTEEPLASGDSDSILANIPLGRVAQPEEIAGAVLFLASGLASFVNGEIINVNGGAVLCG